MVKSSPKIKDKSTFFHGTSRGPTGCFCWASKLLSGTSEAPQAVSIGLRNCYLARFQHPLKPSKASKTLKNLRSSFRRPFAALPWDLPRPHELFSVGLRNCYLALPKRHKMLGFETAIWLAQAVSIGLRNCYLARFQHPLKASKPSKPSQQLSTAFRCFAMGPRGPTSCFLLGFETAIWHFRSATSCFYWAKLLSGTFSAPLKSLKTLTTLAAAFRRPFAALPWALPKPHKLFLLGFETAIWHFRSATSCFYWASKLLSGTLSAPLNTFKTLPAAFDGLSLLCHGLPRPHELFSVGLRKLLSGTSEALGFETAIWHFRSATSFFYWASKLLSGTFSACPLKTLKGLKTLAAAFDGLSLLCHGSSRSPTSCFCWASKLLSGTSEAPQAVSIGLRNCYLAGFQHPLKASKPSKPSQQLSTAFRCLCWASKLLAGTSETPQAVSIGLQTSIWHVFSTP